MGMHIHISTSAFHCLMHQLKALMMMTCINLPDWTSQSGAKQMFPSDTLTIGARQMARSCDALNCCSWINQNSPFRALILKASRLNNQNNSGRTNFLSWTSITDQAHNAALHHNPKHQIERWKHINRWSHHNFKYRALLMHLLHFSWQLSTDVLVSYNHNLLTSYLRRKGFP